MEPPVSWGWSLASNAPERRYIIFRGNGCSYLRAAFARRHPRWSSAAEHHTASGATHVGTGSSSHSSNSTAGCASPPSGGKIAENLLLSKMLTKGDIGFVFRDLLNGPHWTEGPPAAEGQKLPLASLYCDEYPADTVDGKPQIVNRWPRLDSLTSKDGSLRALVAYYRAQRHAALTERLVLVPTALVCCVVLTCELHSPA